MGSRRRGNTFTRFLEDIVDDTRDFVDDLIDRAKDVEEDAKDAVVALADDDEKEERDASEAAALRKQLDDLEAKLDVVFSSMRPELDFTIEAETMDDFRDRVEDFDALKIPEVLYATPRVLVQSLAPGKSIRDVNREDFPEDQRERIGRDLMTFMFWGCFVDRKFHADPGPPVAPRRHRSGPRRPLAGPPAPSRPLNRRLTRLHEKSFTKSANSPLTLLTRCVRLRIA